MLRICCFKPSWKSVRSKFIPVEVWGIWLRSQSIYLGSGFGPQNFGLRTSLLGIRDILVRIRIRGSVPLTKGSGSNSFLYPKEIFFFLFFSYNVPTVLKIQFFAKILCWHFILQALFQSAQHLYEKREGSGSRSIPLTNGSGRPKNIRIRVRIRIPNTAE